MKEREMKDKLDVIIDWANKHDINIEAIPRKKEKLKELEIYGFG